MLKLVHDDVHGDPDGDGYGDVYGDPDGDGAHGCGDQLDGGGVHNCSPQGGFFLHNSANSFQASEQYPSFGVLPQKEQKIELLFTCDHT